MGTLPLYRRAYPGSILGGMKCSVCDQPAAQRVQSIQRKTRKVLLDRPLCAEHVQAELTLAATPGLGMTDVELLPLHDTASSGHSPA